MAEAKVCLVCCYMGPLPRYFPLWLRSCQFNPEVKFLLFGSHLPEESSVENVDFVPITLGELSRRASSTTGVKVEIGSPTKICDFRPAFGQIFRDYLNPFKFWGYCDLDVVWGDLSSLVKENVLAKSDIVSVRGDQFLSGACTFYRNTHDLRTLYKMSPTWNEVFKDPDHWAFDEDFGRGEARSLDVLRNRGEPVSMLDIATNEIEERNLSFYTPDPPYVIQELKPTFEFSLS